MDDTVDPHYARKGKELAAMLFDKRFLNDELSHAAIEWLEGYLGFELQCTAQMAAKVAVLTANMRDPKHPAKGE